MQARSLFWLLGIFGAFSLSAQQHSPVLPGQWLVQLESVAGLSAEGRLETWVQTYAEIDSWYPVAPSLGVYRLEGDPGAGQNWLGSLRQQAGVIAAQPNHRLQQRTEPSDPSFGLQWGLNNLGGPGLADADIDATEAWDITTGGLSADGDTIVIAVIDDGFDLLHEDLQYWVNRGEIAGDGLDNDGNGFVDDRVGWNATDTSGTLPLTLHGTHVCGIAAALGDNGVGVTGVNWNTPVLPIYADLEEDDVVAAYGYVHAMRRLYDVSGGTEGAFIVVTNSSFGIDFAQPVDFPIWCAMYDSLGQLGILNPAATINSLLDVDNIGDVPTGCASAFMVAVTNTDDRDELRGAGFGLESIDLGAPGTQVFSTIPANGYGYNTGTSMATPHVAGTVALMMAAACPIFLEHYRYDPPGMTLLLRDYLLAGVDPVSDLQDVSVSGGRLNVRGALDALNNGYCKPGGLDGHGVPVTDWDVFPNPSTGPVTVRFEARLSSARRFVVVDALGRVCASREAQAGVSVLQWDLARLPAGLYTLRDERGASMRLVR